MLSFVGIFYSISIIASRKSKAIIMNMALAFLMLIASLIMNGMLAYDNNLFIQFLFDLNPYGQIAQLTGMESLNMFRCLIIDMVVFAIFTIFGIKYFDNKDIMN